MITFIADKVKVKTGNVDNGAIVSFEIGEYQVKNIRELVGLVDKNLKITIEILEEKNG